MGVNVNVVCFLFFYILYVICDYQPKGDNVEPGSILLPTTTRGKYLANIVKRQAVDGTGIKFNKDADQMNAEAKKKIENLSEELLPYIIAEQDRRTTLYKRVMTAIQNGEKGVTIAEIRNRPPIIIRKGVIYRCPINNPPIEPDVTGNLMCGKKIKPMEFMYDLCLSAEDRELYVAENKYFFCNRHAIEGPDLPRNGSVVIGCAPIERTSLNETTSECALEDTDDVIVHYRYYPDGTYTDVMKLDPDREVCDHWNPCQIGYIFSLPSPDQALAAIELWTTVQWIPSTSSTAYSLRNIAVLAGHEGYDSSKIWVMRAKYKGDLIVGKLVATNKYAAVPWGGKEIPVKDIEVCVARPDKIRWMESRDGIIPPNAVIGGNTSSGEILYIGRARQQGSLTPGSIYPSHNVMYMAFGNRQIPHSVYEILCTV